MEQNTRLPRAEAAGQRSGLLLLLPAAIRGDSGGNRYCLQMSWVLWRFGSAAVVPSPPRPLPTSSMAAGSDNQNHEWVLPLSLSRLLICRVFLGNNLAPICVMLLRQTDMISSVRSINN
jgi:hypothetical protein